MKLWILFLIIPVIWGCSASQNQVIIQNIQQWDDQGAELTRVAGKQILKHWAMNSAYWKIQIGGKISSDEYYKLRTAMYALDGYVPYKDNLTDIQCAEVVSWYSKWLVAGGTMLVDEYLPKILELLARIK